MKIKLQQKPAHEKATLSVSGVNKELIEKFKERCAAANTERGFVMDQLLEFFLRDTDGQQSQPKPANKAKGKEKSSGAAA